MKNGIAVLAEPFTQQELADFEQLIFASNNPDHKIRLAARVALAQFFNLHGRLKCDLMLAESAKFYDAKRPVIEHAKCTICAAVESSGFYTGCMIRDGHDGDGWACDGEGNLTREKIAP